MTSLTMKRRFTAALTIATLGGALSGCAVASVAVSTVELAGSAVSATADVAGSVISTTADGVSSLTGSDDDAAESSE